MSPVIVMVRRPLLQGGALTASSMLKSLAERADRLEEVDLSQELTNNAESVASATFVTPSNFSF